MSAYHVVSLSGGKDSTAMLIMMLERGMPVEQLERRFAFEDCQTTVLGYIAEREAMERRANDGGYGSGACIASERQGD